jgi:hypothetical protein
VERLTLVRPFDVATNRGYGSSRPPQSDTQSRPPVKCGDLGQSLAKSDGGYSGRIAMSGSTRAASRPGIQAATTVTAINAAHAVTYVFTSVGAMP